MKGLLWCKMKYKILQANGHFELEDKVNEYLQDGWELVGGVAVKSVAGIVALLQAITKKEMA